MVEEEGVVDNPVDEEEDLNIQMKVVGEVSKINSDLT